ncbi:pimeloyl-ACP methyl ester carboxylesterase [Idiomarina fontislapidosi]|uniref:Alpha/beta hydrolase n=1 Tax=Idiomarina fontislapidosi TaxID=263723 RepID=A0A432XX25_9GAMM|nr:alpha/beta hydrolase [Idiomarina fontislapidosi]PYE32041.1 pimeloyl-ACP methyl ester carboxylesterase [Idiomarina fontislapidosi]RUO53247.1 alpha/beta hydrolase [Idiomarina fontislapidosi]
MQELAPGISYLASQGEVKGTCVLLHSSQSSNAQWKLLVQSLNSEYNIVGIDLLGYGRAPQVESASHFRLQQEIDRIEDVLVPILGDQPLTLIGHSYGGAVALKMAQQKHVNVERVVVYEPVSFHVLEEDCPGMQEIRQVSDAMHGKDEVECTRTFIDYWNQPGYFDALPTRVQQAMVAQSAKVALDFDALLNDELNLDDYQQVDAPVLIIQGEYTRRSARAVVKALSTALQSVTVKRVQAGHMGPLTHPAEVNPLILDFI